MSAPEYDEVTCVTAGELRARGFDVPKDIPDCGWVSRASMRVTPGKATGDATTGRLNVDFTVDFTEPFRWVTANVTIGESPPSPREEP